ncbi:hypothetical protein GGS23DRAFT_276103 [Durotheca rogersii]|uniref:uncharacterized protein n=1 Tax=Durotheca rogersii TaxID=419775 RepID=UPI00221E6B5A|nr:uncharacterized protein GGS23DRAFT_276103 [Durotheca rogersii]KAI5866539.1 hypothetical protein GGS23DRAFT_276103 [Durotheca rogersii]
MSRAAQGMPEGSSSDAPLSSPVVSAPSSQSSKPPRVLACTLCHQRKVKCDHNFPCSNCIKSGAECVPTVPARRRPRRQIAKRDLLKRLRRYEELLLRSNINFESLPDSSSLVETSFSTEVDHGSDDDENSEPVDGTESPSPSATAKSERGLSYETKSFWHAMNQSRDDIENQSNCPSYEDRETMVKKAWEQLSGDNILLILGSRKTAANLSHLHPEPIQIFRLWQVYLDNVNPLIKVIHPPSTQGRIIEAMGNLRQISPPFEALLFSIYSMAVLSLSEEDCQTFFDCPREYLLSRYQYGCQQALLNSRFLRTNDRECLTSLFLYSMSIGLSTDPVTLSSILGITHRIARRIGIHNEGITRKHDPFEAEMRRRLWWSFALFDDRMGGMADFKSASLGPTWDCSIPLNVNDSDLWPHMKQAPAARGFSTDATHVVVRAQIGEFIRHSKFHLDFTDPSLHAVARDAQRVEVPDLAALEKMIEEKYLKFCDPDIPLHFLTIWMTRGHMAKHRLVEHYWKHDGSTPNEAAAEANVDATMSHAFTMLECDTKVMTQPTTRGYTWLYNFYFPFPAYLQIIKELRRCPVGKHAERAWGLMDENFAARLSTTSTYHSPLFKVFATTVLPAWDAREAALKESGQTLTPPAMVIEVRKGLVQMGQSTQDGYFPKGADQQPGNGTNMNDLGFSVSMPTSLGINGLLSEMSNGGHGSHGGTEAGIFTGLFGQTPPEEMNPGNWPAMGWGFGG